MATINSARRISAIFLSILFILLATLLQSSTSSSFSATGRDPLFVTSHRTLLALRRSTQQRQIPNCSEMVSISQCSQNPKCRWCESEVLDDMCFSKAEAWRLPQEVFVCD